jgi:hypothetical protein
MLSSLFLFTLAASCNALMDTLQHHFYVSVFKGLNPFFWNPEKSWNNSKYIPYTKYKIDAWHLSKSSMIVLLAASIITFEYPKFLLGVNSFFSFIFLMSIYGTLWNLTFNLFYNRLLKSKD